MNKTNIAIFLFILILALVIVLVFCLYKNNNSIENNISIEDLVAIKNDIDDGKIITIKAFKNYNLKENTKEDNIEKYVYSIDDIYEVCVLESSGRITNIILKNKVTYTSVDIMYSSLEMFLQNE